MGNKNKSRNGTLPNTPPVIHVIWQDTYALDDDWHPAAVTIERRLMRTIGFKIAENDEYVLIASTYDPTADTYGSAIAIHKPCIHATRTITGQ